MKSPTRCHWLAALSLLCCMPGLTATVYKTVDEHGLVSFSDTRPADGALVEIVEIVEIVEQVAPPSEVTEQRLQEMRETTDRMAADRMARERHRAELRLLAAQSEALQPSQSPADTESIRTVYTGFWPQPVRRVGPWWPHCPHPEHPIARPPLRPPGQSRPPGISPLPGNDYPASLIRKSYDPKVQEVFR